MNFFIPTLTHIFQGDKLRFTICIKNLQIQVFLKILLHNFSPSCEPIERPSYRCRDEIRRTYWKRSWGKQDTNRSTSRSILPKELTVEAILSIHHLNNRLAGYAREIRASPSQRLENKYSVNGISESSSIKVSLLCQLGHLQIKNFHQSVLFGYWRIRKINISQDLRAYVEWLILQTKTLLPKIHK